MDEMKTIYRYKPEFSASLNRCSMPNLAAEIHFHVGAHPTTYADHANITMELLEAFLAGKEGITASEFLGMARLNGNGAEYLSCDTLCIYELGKPRDARKVKRILNDYQQRLITCSPECVNTKAGLAYLERLQRMDGLILRAEINRLAHHVCMAELDQKCKEEKKKRRGINPHMCTDLDAIKKITASDGNPEAATSQV